MRRFCVTSYPPNESSKIAANFITDFLKRVPHSKIAADEGYSYCYSLKTNVGITCRSYSGIGTTSVGWSAFVRGEKVRKRAIAGEYGEVRREIVK